MENNSTIIKLTKKYIIDFLSNMFFSELVSWDGDDQFNQLPILSSDDSGEAREEQRGALLVHKKHAWGLRLLVTVVDSTRMRICYRITNLKNKLPIDILNKVCYPFEFVNIDFSISDLNFGAYDPTEYSFCDNTNSNSIDKLFSLLKFVLDCEFIAVEDQALFDDILDQPLNNPPFSGEQHYCPVYASPEKVTS